ncbi:serine hydrolase domain-containing protein [Nocardiopsis sp. MG754419]|uniref:serine hydrolase domain-containing protein n=1 Tax=Nocardiopsis sp. MG754419 TaxID=2259865 RepID=UPI001BA7E6C4|nr:serine hydrolase domain-containing protein [Nocardiopsis sp. MG754419]MBR8742605.1 serine hydrolase [Nocardiopsis sp. MG754419]
MRRRLRSVLAVTVAAPVLVAGVALAPEHPTLAERATGDRELIERARPLLSEDPRSSAVVVRVEGDRTTVARFGSDTDTVYPIASITKTMTGMLLAEAIERGEVTEDTELGTLVDLGDAPAASVTLAELAGHRSGVPNHPSGVVTNVRMALRSLRGHDPYDGDPDTIVAHAADVELSGRGEFTYSNLGFSVLGLALAETAGIDYAALVRARLLVPLGMEDTLIPASVAELPDDAVPGFGLTGRPVAPFTGTGWAASGAVHSTGDDMGRFASALLSGDAPGAGAMEPRWADEGEAEGLGWAITDHDGTAVTWHNGLGGGFASMIALDREAERAVVVLADGPIGVEDVARRLLLEAP